MRDFISRHHFSARWRYTGFFVTSCMASSHRATKFCLLAGSEKPSVLRRW